MRDPLEWMLWTAIAVVVLLVLFGIGMAIDRTGQSMHISGVVVSSEYHATTTTIIHNPSTHTTTPIIHPAHTSIEVDCEDGARRYSSGPTNAAAGDKVSLRLIRGRLTGWEHVDFAAFESDKAPGGW